MKAKFLIPFAIFIVLAGFLFKGLYLDPRALPTTLKDKPIPAFSLPLMFDGEKTFSPEEMKGRVWMLNVWSSWCQPCRQEHPFFVNLKKNGLKTPIVGFLYKDQLGAGRQVLERMGNPYDIVVYEQKNKVGIDLGVTGVPETFIIDKQGFVRAKVSYPILDELWTKEVKPLLDQLEAES